MSTTCRATVEHLRNLRGHLHQRQSPPAVAALSGPNNISGMFTPEIRSAVKKSPSETPTASRVLGRAFALVLVGALVVLAPAQSASAQGGGGGGQNQSSAPPAASIGPKKNADRDDPINFLLERKKLLVIGKSLEDSLKNYRDEMRHMQDVVFKDLDKAASKKTNGQLPSATLIATMTKEAEERVKDIQSAYRDRARLLLSDRQKTQMDSIDNVWKRSTP